MPDLKEIAKSGWHSKGDFKDRGKDRIAGLVGRGKDNTSIPAEHRKSRPLSSLTDPDLFPPPPKHVHARPNQVTSIPCNGGHVLTNKPTADTSDSTEPLAVAEIEPKPTTEETKPKAPPVPFRIDTTGLSTSHLPPPPKRKDGADGGTLPAPGPKPKPPGLPPRLPPRETSYPASSPVQRAAVPEPDAHKGILNQDSLNRLGAAGVSVSSLGIGGPAASSPSQNQLPSSNVAQLNELQSRFSRLHASSSPASGSPVVAPKPISLKSLPSSRQDLPSPISSPVQPSALGKKKPPPPPAKKPNLMSPTTQKDAAPPPIPISNKPKFQPINSHTQDLDLDLKSLWFSKSPPSFPPASINRLPGSRSYASSSGWSSSGVRRIHTFTGAIRHNTTLATTIIHLTWDSSNPSLTVKAEQRHIPPPRKLSRAELDAYRDEYSDAIARWSESNMGQKVGDGECWTLANEALKAVGANASSQGREPCMPSQSYVHGSLIYSFIPATSSYPEPMGGVREAGVARGDIIQLLSTHFKSKDGRSQKWAGAPDHTAVVVGVESDGVVRVVEQNIGGVKKVGEGSYDMTELVKGEVRIFRAVGESWVGKLDPRW